MRVLLLVAAVLLSSVALAQTVTIKKIELAGENVVVHYELEDSNPNNEYLINLYSSKDNYFAALSKVTGDVGMDIKPGANKKIVWRIRDEYGGYKGKIALEIRGKVYVPFVRLQGFDANKKYKKGSTINLSWKPGASNPINIELYKGGQRIQGDMNLPNNGSHAFFIQKQVGAGSDYRIKITDSRNTDEVVYTNYFKVGSKIKVWMIAAPIAVIGGLVAVLAGGGSKDPEDIGDNKLPKAPDPN